MKFRKKGASLAGLVTAGSIGAALTIGALAIAPAASASPTGFLNEVYAAGFWNTNGDAGLLTQGYWTCNELDNGYTPDNVAMRLDWVNAFDPGAVGALSPSRHLSCAHFMRAKAGSNPARSMRRPSSSGRYRQPQTD